MSSNQKLLRCSPLVQDVRCIRKHNWYIHRDFRLPWTADVMIALLLCYYLQRGRSGFEKWVEVWYFVQFFLTSPYRTNSLIAQLLRYTVSTGLATRSVIIFTLSRRTLAEFGVQFACRRLPHRCTRRLEIFCGRVLNTDWLQYFARPHTLIFIVRVYLLHVSEAHRFNCVRLCTFHLDGCTQMLFWRREWGSQKAL